MHKWTMFALVCISILLGLSILFTTIPGDKTQEEEQATVDAPLDKAAAETVYSKNCLLCHGDQLQGGGGPELDKVGATMTKEQIARQITNGGGGMPGFKSSLKPEEISNLSLWLSEMK